VKQRQRLEVFLHRFIAAALASSLTCQDSCQTFKRMIIGAPQANMDKVYFIFRFSGLGVLLFASWNMFEAFAARPAFNHALQREVVSGGTRPVLQQSLYRESDYLFQIAYGYQNAAAVPLLKEGAAALPSAEDIDANAEKARDYATQSLRLSPANPVAWLVLASANATWGTPPENVVSALRNSQIIAPTSLDIVARRLLTSILFASLQEATNGSYPVELRAIMEQDVSTLKASRGNQLKSINNTPYAARFLEAAGLK